MHADLMRHWLLCVPTDSAGPKAPAAGSTASKLPTDDAAQLRSLLAFKAAVDDSGILKREWTAAGAGHKYCGWKYVVCDTTGRVVEGINMTTDAYEVRSLEQKSQPSIPT